MNVTLFGPTGAGKTVNASLVKAEKRGRNCMLNSDNSHIVLQNFKRDNLDIEVVQHWMKKDATGKEQDCFEKQFERAVSSGKYDNIIVDNISDIFDLAILEMEASGRYKDMRQAYQAVYMDLRRLSRKAGQLDCNVIFTAWDTQQNITKPDGSQIQRTAPQIPAKIANSFLGLCQAIGYVTKGKKDGKDVYYYILEGSENLIAKDQIHQRKACMPEDIFTGTPVKNGGK